MTSTSVDNSIKDDEDKKETATITDDNDKKEPEKQSSEKETLIEKAQSPLDTLGLLAEVQCRDGSDEDIDADEDEVHTPESEHDNADERDNGDDCEMEQTCEDELNAENENYDDQDDEIDINDDFVLRYESDEDKDFDSKKETNEDQPNSEKTDMNECIVNVVSLASSEQITALQDDDKSKSVEKCDENISTGTSSEAIMDETICEKETTICDISKSEEKDPEIDKLQDKSNEANDNAQNQIFEEILEEKQTNDNKLTDSSKVTENNVIDIKSNQKDAEELTHKPISVETSNLEETSESVVKNDTDINESQVKETDKSSTKPQESKENQKEDNNLQTNQQQCEASIVVIDVSDDEKPNNENTDKSSKLPIKRKRKPNDSKVKSNRTKPVSNRKKRLHHENSSIEKNSQVIDIVDLGGSSDEENVGNKEKTTTVCIPSSIEVTSSHSTANSSKISCNTDSGASVISGLPVSHSKQSSSVRINTAEITISTVFRNNSESNSAPMVEPVEIFNLDSGDEDTDKQEVTADKTMENNDNPQPEAEMKKAQICINPSCKSDVEIECVLCPLFVLSMYKIAKGTRSSHPKICVNCLKVAVSDTELLIEKFCTGVSLIDTEFPVDDLVEVLDSDSDTENNEYVPYSISSPLPDEEIDYLEQNLSSVLEDMCNKFKLNEQIEMCTKALQSGLQKLEESTSKIEKEINAVLEHTASIGKQLYDEIKIKREFLPPLLIPSDYDNTNDTDDNKFVFTSKNNTTMENDPMNLEYGDIVTRRSQRLRKYINSIFENEEQIPQAIMTPFTPALPAEPLDISEIQNMDLPPPGSYIQPVLAVGNLVYTVKHSIFGAWVLAEILNINPVGTPMANGMPLLFSLFNVKYYAGGRQNTKQVTGRQVAHCEPAKVRYPIGTRVIALFKDMVTTTKKESYYSGVIAETPTKINKFRYLIFFDDGYSQYVCHKGILPVAERSMKVWEDVHPDSRDFVRKYLANYPDRPMVRMQSGQIIKTEKNGSWWDAKVIDLDASLALLRFEGAGTRDEWIYRGSTRLSLLYQQLQAADRRAHAPARYRPSGAIQVKSTKMNNVPYVEYTRQDSDNTTQEETSVTETVQKPQRAVAKKSTSSVQPEGRVEDLTPEIMDSTSSQVKSRVVYYSPKDWIHPEQMAPHRCSEKCRNNKILPLCGLRTYNPLARPLLSAWERHIVKNRYKRIIMYRAPCGRRIRNMVELHKYLQMTKSDMSVDLFDFNPRTHCLAEFVLIKCFVNKPDISHGAEAVPVPCVNYYDHSLPEFWSYSTTRQPTKGVDLNLDEDFLCACDCTDDCRNKERCQCWQLTFEGLRYLDLPVDNVGYQYRRLLEQVPTGIYECNSRCKCAATCLNRVVQHPLQLKLQVFKTYNRGWGIRALNDIPKGSFICIYAGNLLTDAVANVDGRNHEGDKYLADLDYIEVVERLKESYESDVPDEDKILDNERSDSESSENENEYESEPSKTAHRNESDEEFNPIGIINDDSKGVTRLLRPRRKHSNDSSEDSKNIKKSKSNIKTHDTHKNKATIVSSEADSTNCENKTKNEEKVTGSDHDSNLKSNLETTNKQANEESMENSNRSQSTIIKKSDSTNGKETENNKEQNIPVNKETDFITISDDDEVIREPSRFAAPEGFDDDEYISKHRSVRSFYGNDEACFIMDARIRGNIGRYLNHSCSPNVFVQNVFVDTHDPRFPWVAFFALIHIKAGTELTWNYNYDVGSVPGKVIYCRCGAVNCRGRLL